MSVKAVFTAADLRRMAETLLPCVADDEAKGATVKAYIELLQKLPFAMIEATIPLPVGKGYDLAKGRYVFFDGRKATEGKVELS